MRVMPTLAGALLTAGLLGAASSGQALSVEPPPAQLVDFDAYVDKLSLIYI